MKSKAQLKKNIEKGILSSNRVLVKAIQILYEYQTSDEKDMAHTNHWNGVGFNKPDAFKLTLYAEELMKGKYLRKYEIDDARKRMVKYSSQLARIDNLENWLFERSEVSGIVEVETKKAALIRFGSGSKIWVPKSTIHIDVQIGIEKKYMIDNWILKRNSVKV